MAGKAGIDVVDWSASEIESLAFQGYELLPGCIDATDRSCTDAVSRIVKLSSTGSVLLRSDETERSVEATLEEIDPLLTWFVVSSNSDDTMSKRSVA